MHQSTSYACAVGECERTRADFEEGGKYPLQCRRGFPRAMRMQRRLFLDVHSGGVSECKVVAKSAGVMARRKKRNYILVA